MAAGWFELTRAMAGREIAWVYAGEWPLYGILGTYLWWKLLHSDVAKIPSLGSNGPQSPSTATDGPSVPQSAATVEQSVVATDPQLVAWQSYLSRLHAVDPPGGPPARN